MYRYDYLPAHVHELIQLYNQAQQFKKTGNQLQLSEMQYFSILEKIIRFLDDENANSFRSDNLIKILSIMDNYGIKWPQIYDEYKSKLLCRLNSINSMIFKYRRVSQTQISIIFILLGKIELPWNNLPAKLQHLLIVEVMLKIRCFDEIDLYNVFYSLTKIGLDANRVNDLLQILLQRISEQEILQCNLLFNVLNTLYIYNFNWDFLPEKTKEKLLDAAVKNFYKYDEQCTVSLLISFTNFGLTWGKLSGNFELAQEAQSQDLTEELFAKMINYQEDSIVNLLQSMVQLKFHGFKNYSQNVINIVERIKNFSNIHNAECAMQNLLKLGVSINHFPEKYKTVLVAENSNDKSIPNTLSMNHIGQEVESSDEYDGLLKNAIRQYEGQLIDKQSWARLWDKPKDDADIFLCVNRTASISFVPVYNNYSKPSAILKCNLLQNKKTSNSLQNAESSYLGTATVGNHQFVKKHKRNVNNVLKN